MVKNLIIIILSLALLACLYGGIYGWITADTAKAMQSDYPELEWLRREYRLSDSQFAEIRVKHEAHDIVCRELCHDLVKAQKDLDMAIAKYPTMSGEVQASLESWTAQRNRCHQAALAHMYEIGSVMDEDSAPNYREKIFRHLIIAGNMPHIGKNGEFHEELIEHAAPDSTGSTTSNDD